MYEFNGWAVIESNEGTDEADGELMERLVEHLDELDEQSRKHFHTAGFVLNGFRSVFVSGLRNHPQPDVMGLFDWLARRSRRCYGLLYVRDDSWGEPDRFDVWRLQDGNVTHHDDPFFT